MIGQLVFKSYMPKELEEGMLFIQQTDWGDNAFLKVFEIQNTNANFEEFIALNGAPVEPYIIALKEHPDAKETILATPEQIGWWDEGDDAEEYTEFSVVEMNYLLENYDGYVDIETHENEEIVIFEEWVILSSLDTEEQEDVEEETIIELDEDFLFDEEFEDD